MKKSTNLRHGRHCVFALHTHLVFVTKYRKHVFTKKMILTLKEIFYSICKDFEAELVEFDGETDHVHLLVNYPPKVSISKLVNSLKGVSSRLLKKTSPEIVSKYWKGALWSASYFAASCGGAPISIIKQYIENQKTPMD
jgi:putative transposase